jgi:hypothetical protein
MITDQSSTSHVMLHVQRKFVHGGEHSVRYQAWNANKNTSSVSVLCSANVVCGVEGGALQ